MQQHHHCFLYPTLANTVQEAPALLDWLSPTAMAALSGCNRQLRACVRSVAKRFLMCRRSHLAIVRTSDWPQLEMIVWRTATHPKSPFDGQFELIATLELRRKRGCIALFLVRPRQSCKQRPPYQQLSTALLYLQEPQHAKLRQLVVCHSPLDAHSVTKIVTPKWKNLYTLSVSKIKLDSNAASLLAFGVWPRLFHLDLSMCGLDTAAMARIVRGQWPKLEELNLSDNPLLDGAAVSMLALANWPRLDDVMLNGIQLGSGSFDWMVHRQWALLEVLGLCNTGIDAAVMSELAHAHMNVIVSLDLAGNALGSAAMAALVTVMKTVWIQQQHNGCLEAIGPSLQFLQLMTTC